eukprot:328006_1
MHVGASTTLITNTIRKLNTMNAIQNQHKNDNHKYQNHYQSNSKKRTISGADPATKGLDAVPNDLKTVEGVRDCGSNDGVSGQSKLRDRKIAHYFALFPKR